MPFVKLDCNMLNSTLWFQRVAREVFITALMMAEPFETADELTQLQVRSLDETGWKIPPGKYGFVPAAGIGIIRRAMLTEAETEIGLDALEILGNPEQVSRTSEFEGRRLVRVDGGFIILNFNKYRERDYTAAIRQQRFRAKKHPKKKRNAVTPLRNAVTSRKVTEAEAEADKKVSNDTFLDSLKKDSFFAGVDIDQELIKAKRWCKTKNRKCTERFFRKWCERSDRIVPDQISNSTSNYVGADSIPPESTEEERQRQKIIISQQVKDLAQQFKMQS